jgi:glutamyl-tRNA reductase
MHIVLVGLNHRSAPIELREQLAFRRDELPGAFAKLRAEVGLQEAAILSTCNRVEVYAGVPELNGTVDRLQRFLSEHARIGLPGLAPRLYSYAEPQSVRHLFSVTSGLDSMVLGEGEILHQVKHAYEWARDDGATGKLFNVLFQRALNAAKAVRTQTAIGRGCTSIGTVSVELAEKIFGTLSGATALLIGAGKIGELTLKRLATRGVREVRIINRSLNRAVSLASTYRAIPCPIEQLATQLLEADIVISSTSAPSYLLCRDDVALAMRGRHQRPLCLVDLGVPRNIEPAIGGLENVYLFDVDDLQGLVDHSHQERLQALSESEAIIDQKVNRFFAWWQREVVSCVPS